MKKNPLVTAMEAAKSFFDLLFCINGDSICLNHPTLPEFVIATGSPYWNYERSLVAGTPTPAWWPAGIDDLFFVAVYDTARPQSAEKVARTVMRKAEENPLVRNPLGAVWAPFSLNGVALERSTAMFVDHHVRHELTPSRQRDMAWKETVVVRCSLDSFLTSFDRKAPDVFAKAVGMGYRTVRMFKRPMTEKLKLAYAGLLAASRANGLSYNPVCGNSNLATKGTVEQRIAKILARRAEEEARSTVLSELCGALSRLAGGKEPAACTG